MTTAQQVRRQTGHSDNVNEFYTAAKREAEKLARLHVVLALRNQVERLGIEQMLWPLDIVASCRSHEDLAGAVQETALREPAVLIVALREIDQLAGSILRSATRQGIRVLVLIDEDLAHLSRLTGIRSSGLVSIRDLSASSLQVALQRLRCGEMPIPPHVAHFLVAAASEEQEARTSWTRVRLTPREQEVLVLLVEGLTNIQLARRMAISVHGAKRHVANVLAKLDCSNRTLAVAKALREGLYQEYS